MAADAKPLNVGLFRVHRIFMIAYGAFGAMLLIVGLLEPKSFSAFGGFLYFGLFVGAIGLAHWYAMKGASLGKPYGRKISRMFACVWLIGFPVGTFLGIYVLIKANDENWIPEPAAADAM